jgi:2-polyprenyl-3-methyl-5-hydroxy-6-metoxy-1,4-benzoquinol methylase
MARARYDAIADFYAARFDALSDPASRALLDLLGPVAGLDVLDAACGHGRMTRELARRGANVAGVDISGMLISRAIEAERAEPLGIDYQHADISAVGALPADAFDLVVCHFGLSDIDDLDAAVGAISAALRRDGGFVFSILHPCFGGGKDIAGSWPTAGSYYDEGHWTAQEPRSTLRRQVGAQHRMLSTYLGSLKRAGLWLDAMAEPPPAPGWDPAHDADRGPVHLVVRAVRCEPSGPRQD